MSPSTCCAFVSIIDSMTTEIAPTLLDPHEFDAFMHSVNTSESHQTSLHTLRVAAPGRLLAGGAKPEPVSAHAHTVHIAHVDVMSGSSGWRAAFASLHNRQSTMASKMAFFSFKECYIAY